MSDVPMFDIPEPCDRCGATAMLRGGLCGYCLHLDHRTTPPQGCVWCAGAVTDAGRAGATAASHADPDFAHQVQRALAVVRDRREPFTSAEVRAELHNRGVVITRPAAIGSVFTAAHAAGIIRPNGDFVPSPVKGQHGRPLRVWVAA